MLQLLAVTIPILALAFAGFAIKILFKKNGQFPETRVGHNKNLRKKKIYCIKTEQKIIDNKIKKSKQNGGISCGTC